jgi:hypothetical protein
MGEQIRQQQQEAAMLAHDGYRGFTSPGAEAVLDAARLGDDKQFAILEQRRFEQCEALASPENDAIVGTALVVWSARHISVLEKIGRQDYPIATSGRALRGAISSIPAGSHINVFPETPEVYESLKMSNDILAHGWAWSIYCTVPEWIELIQTMCTCGSEITVQEIDESHECGFKRMRSLGIWEAQETMEYGVSIRENGHTDFIA